MYPLTNRRMVQQLCRDKNIHLSKSAGQNFLVNERILNKIMTAADLTAEDNILEIGPGLGTLTFKLAPLVHQLVAIEVDPILHDVLHEVTETMSSVKLVLGNVLSFSNTEICQFFDPVAGSKDYKIVSNLPYGITAAVLKKFLATEPKPRSMILMVQKEVGERMCAVPSEMSLLSVSVQFFSRPKILFSVPHSYFWPVPKVDSVVVRLDPILSHQQIFEQYGIRPEDFFRIVKMGFSSRRKQLQNNLVAGLRLPRENMFEQLRVAGLSPKIRAQELSIQDWVRLVKTVETIHELSLQE